MRERGYWCRKCGGVIDPWRRGRIPRARIAFLLWSLVFPLARILDPRRCLICRCDERFREIWRGRLR
jgi:hypothetical protein